MRIHRRAITLMALTAMLLPMGAKAEDSWDKQSYWYGFLIGAGSLTCGFLKQGLISKGDAKESLKELFEPLESVPQISRTAALQELTGNKELKSCPLPR